MNESDDNFRRYVEAQAAWSDDTGAARVASAAAAAGVSWHQVRADAEGLCGTPPGERRGAAYDLCGHLWAPPPPASPAPREASPVVSSAASPVVYGYAMVWADECFANGRRERFFRGAFLAILDAVRQRSRRVELKVNHRGAALASTAAATLTLWENEHGLRYVGDLTGAEGRAAAEAIRAGNCHGVSVGCGECVARVVAGRRIVTDANLNEISLTVGDERPLYRMTTANLLAGR